MALLNDGGRIDLTPALPDGDGTLMQVAAFTLKV